MVQRADSYKMKLTLMFSAQFADHILESPERTAEVRQWKASGHEIAAHHHSIFHGNWDGYTAVGRETALQQRIVGAQRSPMVSATLAEWGGQPEPYLGTLDDFMDHVRSLDADVQSGCANDEGFPRALPDGILFDTCSGYANFGSPGQTLQDDASADKGRNEYISVGKVNGITRKWLCHYQTVQPQRVAAAREVFRRMSAGVYGSVNHSTAREFLAFCSWIDFLHSRDPEGRLSRTVASVIDQKLLPEVELPAGCLVSRPLPGES
jgi:hypothetical protein